jgi:prevent-host-death family protein
MKIVSATEAKNRFGDILTEVLSTGTVVVTKNGKPALSIAAITPPSSVVPAERKTALLTAYAQGRLAWSDLRDALGDPWYGDILEGLAGLGLTPPQVNPLTADQQQRFQAILAKARRR